MTEHLTDVKEAKWTLLTEGCEYAEHLKASNVAGYTIVEDMANEIERLRTALTGISTCSTCEACRGAALRALGAPSTTEVVRSEAALR